MSNEKLENEKLMKEKKLLREQLEEAEKQEKITLPDYSFEKFNLEEPFKKTNQFENNIKETIDLFNKLLSSHILFQHLRNFYRTVCLLIVFQNSCR